MNDKSPKQVSRGAAAPPPPRILSGNRKSPGADAARLTTSVGHVNSQNPAHPKFWANTATTQTSTRNSHEFHHWQLADELSQQVKYLFGCLRKFRNDRGDSLSDGG